MRFTSTTITTTALAALLVASVAGCNNAAADSTESDAEQASEQTATTVEDLSGTFYSVDDLEEGAILSSWKADGGEMTEVLNIPDGMMLNVSPDAKFASWLQPGGSKTHELVVADLSSGEETVIYDYEIMGHSIYTEPVWAPDGRSMLLVQPRPGGEIYWHDVEADTQSDPIPVDTSWPIPVSGDGDGFDYYLWSAESAALEVTDPSGDIAMTGVTAAKAEEAGLSDEIRTATASNGRYACLKVAEEGDNGAGLGAATTCEATFEVESGELIGVEHPKQQLFLLDGSVLTYYFDGGPDGADNLLLSDEEFETVAEANIDVDAGDIAAYVP